MKRKLVALGTATALMVMAFASPVLAANAAPGNSDFTGQGAKTANFAPASSPGNS